VHLLGKNLHDISNEPTRWGDILAVPYQEYCWVNKKRDLHLTSAINAYSISRLSTMPSVATILRSSSNESCLLGLPNILEIVLL
jgi:hypothetical protein